MILAINTLSVVPGRVGGGETYLANLTRAMVPLLETSERMVLFLTRENAGLFPEEGERVRRRFLPIPRGVRPARLLAEHLVLPFLVRNVDVLLSPGNAIPPLAGVRHVLALQSMHYRFVGDEMAPSRVHYFRTMVPLSAGRAARVVCMSEDLRASLLEVCPRARRKSVVVHEGADLTAFTPRDPHDPPGDYLLYVSSLNRFKRPDSVVRALAHLRREGFEPPPVRMAGRPDPADRARVEELANAESVADLVRIEGVVPHEDLPGLYRGAICLVYPSAVETFGLPPLEAMACGCPVVASNRTSVPEVVGDAGRIVDPDDIPALAAAVRECITNRGLREELARRGRRNLARFTWERAAAETLRELRAAAS